MTRNRKAVDQIVRRINPVPKTETASLIEWEVKETLLQRIVASEPESQLPSSNGWRKGRLFLVAATLVLVGTSGAVVSQLALRDRIVERLPTAGISEESDDAPGAQTGRCVEEYSLSNLKNRAFAFDGSVAAISTAGEDEGDEPYSKVSFVVHEWFRGGEGSEVTVMLLDPSAYSSDEKSSFGEGSRLLVSGEPRWGGGPLDDPIGWACGFTRPYDPATAQQWADAFSR